MTHHQRLALVLLGESEVFGDEAAGETLAVEVDPNAIGDLEFRLKVSNRLIAVERQAEETRRVVNRILTRFAIEGRPLPEEAA